MVIRYGEDLSRQDLLELCNFYHLESEGSLSSEDIKFLLLYRNQLFSSMEYLWKAHVKDKQLNLNKATEGIANVALLLEEYFSKTNEENVFKRLVFINNIENEIKCVNNSIMWILHKYSGENAENVAGYEKQIVDFLKMVAVKQLIDLNLNEMLNKVYLKQAETLTQKLKTQFLSYIDVNDVSFHDNYFLIGESLNRIEKYSDKIEKLNGTKCHGCLIDDCAISHCLTHYQIIECENEIKTYRRIIDICAKRLQGLEADSENVEKANKYLRDEDVKVVLNKLINILPIETRNDRVKKIKIETLTDEPALINAEGVKNYLAQSDVDINKVYYENIDLIATSLLLKRCDYSNALGNNIYKDFESWYSKEGRFLLKNEYFVGYLSDLNKKYKIIKDKEKENS